MVIDTGLKVLAAASALMTIIHVSVHPSVSHPSIHILIPDDKLSKHRWIYIKLGIDIVEIWFGIDNGQISSNFGRVICPRQVHSFVSRR